MKLPHTVLAKDQLFVVLQVSLYTHVVLLGYNNNQIMLLLSIICVSVIFGTFLMTFSPKIFLELRSSGVLTLLYLCCHPLQVKLTKYICKQLQCKQRVPERQRTQALASYPRLGDWLCTINLRPELIQVLFVHTVCVFLFC